MPPGVSTVPAIAPCRRSVSRTPAEAASRRKQEFATYVYTRARDPPFVCLTAAPGCLQWQIDPHSPSEPSGFRRQPCRRGGAGRARGCGNVDHSWLRTTSPATPQAKDRRAERRTTGLSRQPCRRGGAGRARGCENVDQSWLRTASPATPQAKDRRTERRNTLKTIFTFRFQPPGLPHVALPVRLSRARAG